jgi:DNA repair protein RecO (recombination protein O)
VPGRSELTDALLLRSVDFGEADRVVTLLTASHGQASYLARGARRSKKRFGSALEPFQLLRVQLAPGRGQLGSLQSAQVLTAFPGVLSSLERLGAASSAFELLRALVSEGQADPGLFTTAVTFLQVLDHGAVEPRALSVAFWLRALTLAGFAPGLQACGVCGKRPGSGQAALFDPRSGRIVCRACGGASERLSGEVREAMQLALGPDWYEAPGRVPPAELAALERAVRSFVEARIERPLSSWTTPS